MPLPHLRQSSRLRCFLGLGIITLLLILGFNLHPLPGVAKQVPANRSLPAIAQTTTTANLVQQGKTAYQQGQLNQAIELWQQAIAAFTAQGDRLQQGMTLSYLAQAYQQAGDWEKARNAIAQSLELLTQTHPGPEHDRWRILAEAQTIQGSLQLDQGQASAAFSSWQQAEKSFQQAGDRAGVIRSQINQSQALIPLGLYKRAHQLLEPLYAQLPAAEPLQLAILLNYGDTLRLLGHLQSEPLKSAPNAETVLQQGLTLAQKLNSAGDIARSQISLGNIYRALYYQKKRLQPNPCPDPDVLAYQSKALQAYQKAAATTSSPTSRIQALLNQQSLLLAGAKETEAKETENIGAKQLPAIADLAAQIQTDLERLLLNRTSLYARIQLADNWLKMGNPQPAQPLLQTAIAQAEQMGDQAAQSYALGYLAQVYNQQQQTGNAQRLTVQALALTSKALALAKALNTPELAYRWLWQLGQLERTTNPERALKNYRAAYQTIQSFRPNLAPDNPDLQFSFRETVVERVYREYVDLLLQPPSAQTKALSSTTPEAYLKEARQVIQDLQSAELSNFLQEPCALSDIAAIDKQVDKGSSTATLYPILLPDRIEVIAKLPKKPLFHYAYKIPETEVRQKLNQFQLDLQESYTFDQVRQSGEEIYRWLLSQDMEMALKQAQIKTIVFSLDGPFRNIPMAALHDGSGYLIEKYAVAVTLDLVVTDPKSLPGSGLHVLTASLADPHQQQGNITFAKLPYVDAEIDAIQKTAGITVTSIREQQFTRNGFNKRFNDAPFQIVHIASHGQFSSNPAETFILTAASSAGDGKVRLNDFDALFRTRALNRADAIDLLILSACETASGDDRATLGIAGTAVRAGARSAIASLWSLDDQSSQTLMATFYKAITQPHTSRAAALRQAQLALLQSQDGVYAHPRYWAPFLLVGNWL